MDKKIASSSEKSGSTDVKSIRNSAGAFGWIIGLLAATTLGLALYAGRLAAVGFYRASMSQALEEELRSQNNPHTALMNPLVRDLQVDAARRVRQLAGVHMLIKEGDFKKALSVVDRSAVGSQKEVKLLKSILADGSEVRKEKTSAAAMREAAIKQVRLQMNRYQLLQRDFAGLLEISLPERDDSRQDGAAFENVDVKSLIYQTGIFAGLPAIAGLPDNITDLQVVYDAASPERQDALINKFAADNVDFRNELIIVKNRMEEVGEEIAVATARLDTAVQATAAAERDYRALKRKALKQTVELLIVASRPPFDEHVELAYGEVVRQAEKFGYSLPRAKAG